MEPPITSVVMRLSQAMKKLSGPYVKDGFPGQDPVVTRQAIKRMAIVPVIRDTIAVAISKQLIESLNF